MAKRKDRKLGELTDIENIALSLVFDALGEQQINRSAYEYAKIAQSLPPLKVLHHLVNEKLRERLAARPAMIRRGVMVNLLLQTDMNR